MRTLPKFFASLLLICSMVIHIHAQVTVSETTITLPTYLLDPADKSPSFFLPERYQGAQLRIYPYANDIFITSKKKDVIYKALYLENEYIELCVLPELGGRFYSAVDKINGYDIIYRNNVIKPALIGMTGAWISGGVEWNIPHHHRASTILPVNYSFEEHADGSKTIWVGETEKRTETRWIVGLTLHPGKAFIETTIKYLNATPLAQSFKVWANTAVHANADYQVIFPPDVERAVYHSKTDFTDYPIADQIYDGIDFRGNVDLSWWKNTSSPTSFFAWDTKMDFMAGIDHGKKAGTVKVGDHYVFSGKKFWNWGNNNVQRLWDDMLTDNDGPYLELMMGMYSDNQPDYSWNTPFGIKEGTMYFAPLRNMTSVKNATRDAAINLQTTQSTVLIELNTYANISNAHLILKENGTERYSEVLSLNPATEYRKELKFKANMEDLSVELIDKNGKEIISYALHERKNKPLPELYQAPDEPSNKSTVEELFLTGLRLEQFHNFRFDPVAYYEEALKRDPNSFLVNTQMGIWWLRHYDYEKAETYLRKATNKVTANHTQPRYAESLYYLGLCLLRQQKFSEARDWFMQASWDNSMTGPALFMAAHTWLPDQPDKAVDLANQSLRAQISVETYNLLTTLNRIQGNLQNARLMNEKARDIDPLNPIAFFENHRLGTQITDEEFRAYIGPEADLLLTVSGFYIAAGLFEEALKPLSLAAESQSKDISEDPLVYYYKQYIYQNLNKETLAQAANEKARSCNLDYVFPYGATSLQVLNNVTQVNDKDANAFYLLGNLICDNMPNKALQAWEKSIELNPEFAMAYRNIAFVQAHIHDDIEGAISNQEKAISLKADPVWVQEADTYLEYAGKSPEKRLAFAIKHDEVVSSWDKTILSKIDVLIAAGKHEEAIQLLKNNHFFIAEITTLNPHKSWSFAHLNRGVELFQQEKFNEAMADFNAMNEFPRNLEIARDLFPLISNYWLGKIYQERGSKRKARKYFAELANFTYQELKWGAHASPLIDFYKAKCLEELGQTAQSAEIYNQLINKGSQAIQYKPAEGLLVNSVKIREAQSEQIAGGYFSLALGYLGQNMHSLAIENFNKAKQQRPSKIELSAFPYLVNIQTSGL